MGEQREAVEDHLLIEAARDEAPGTEFSEEVSALIKRSLDTPIAAELHHKGPQRHQAPAPT